ncbi:MAG TPA: zinc ribbon domain-containing protein [Firmicutes bacterium]|nr:zinc ribbon domain-containing protein [Bacillota bacterium]
MPTYEFRCRKCRHEFSAKSSMKDKVNIVCPTCGGKELEELFGNYRFHVGGKATADKAMPPGCRECPASAPT